MNLKKARKMDVYTENGSKSVIYEYRGWDCKVEGHKECQFKVNISVFNYDEAGNKTSGCLAGQLIEFDSIAELKEVTSYYIDRVEMSSDAILELVDWYGEVLELEEVIS
ncbi:hypothetical protein [Marinicellulosiphila megalodicopiae]|uniref:hypothetical protein n=1 Tax=Marinicellulosiphila megalodicopiae TaxID=2724896 RepID=UPI003BB0E897